MGARGPAPTPTALKRAMGRRVQANSGEPTPDLCIPPMPDHIKEDPIAAREWDNISIQLYRIGLLTRIDSAQLEVYCAFYSQMLNASRKIREFGMIVKDKWGRIGTNPAVRIMQQSAREVQKCLSKFGMNPADRTRIRIEALPQIEDNVDDFYSHIDNPTPNGKAKKQ